MAGWVAFWFVVPVILGLLLVVTFRGPTTVSSNESLLFEIQAPAAEGPFIVNLTYSQSTFGEPGIVTEHADLWWRGTGSVVSKPTPVSVYDDRGRWLCHAGGGATDRGKRLAACPKRAVKGLISDPTRNSALLEVPSASTTANTGEIRCDLRIKASFSSAPHITATSPDFSVATPRLQKFTDSIALTFDPSWSIDSTVPGVSGSKVSTGSGEVHFTDPEFEDSPALGMTSTFVSGDSATITNPRALQLNEILQQTLLLVAGAWIGIIGGIVAPALRRRPRLRSTGSRSELAESESIAPIAPARKRTVRTGSPRQRIGRRVAGRK
jgi:hypothetical protein